MPHAQYFSADDVRALPDDGNRYETVHGELLVTPSPAPIHQLAHSRLFMLLGRYLGDHGLEAPFSSPSDISSGEDTLVQPDLFVADMDDAVRTGDWRAVTTFHLVIEILSPSSLRADRFAKRRLYQEQHVPAYWVVDGANRLVEVWTPESVFPVVENERLRWRHPLAEAACEIDLRKIFA